MQYAEQYLVAVLTFGSLIVFTAASYALFITYRILKKYSDYGDSSCKLQEYSQRGIGYYRTVNDAPENEKRLLFIEYGENPYASIKRSIPEVLLKNEPEKEPDPEF